MIVYEKDGVIGTRICEREWIEYIKLEFDSHSEVKPHIVDNLVDFYILKGIGIITVNGRDISLEVDSLISVAPGSSRGIRAGVDGLTVLVIKHLKV